MNSAQRIRPNHEFLINTSTNYSSLFETGLGQVEKSEIDGFVQIRLFDPNEPFKTFFGVLKEIWPVLDPGFFASKKFNRIEIIPGNSLGRLRMDAVTVPKSLVFYYETQVSQAIDEILEFYFDYLISQSFQILIRNTEAQSGIWNPYNDGDSYILTELHDLFRSQFYQLMSHPETIAEFIDRDYWIRQILCEVKNSKKYVPTHSTERAKLKYIELEFILNSLG